jgi:hypothetical protein
MPSACNVLPPTAATVDPTSKSVAAASPYPTGGDLKEGVYVRVGAESYTGPGGEIPPPGRVARGLLGVTKTGEGVWNVDLLNVFVVTETQLVTQRATQIWTRRGSSIAVLPKCPQMGMAPADETVSGYSVEGDDLLTFSVVRLPSGAPAVGVTRYRFQPGVSRTGAMPGAMTPGPVGTP